MTDDKIVEAMARAIEERRDELIHQPLARIYGELARAALSVARPMIEAQMLKPPATSSSRPTPAIRALPLEG